MRGPQLFWLAFGFVSRVIKVRLFATKITSQNGGLWNVLQQGSLGMNVSVQYN